MSRDATSESDPETHEETITFQGGVNLFEKHAHAIATGTPNAVMLSLSTLHNADFSTERARNQFYQTGGHQALISLLTLNRQADLGPASGHIVSLIQTENLRLILKLVAYDNVSRALFAGPISQTPEQYNKQVFQRRSNPEGINYEDYSYVNLDAGVPIYTSLVFNESLGHQNRVLATKILIDICKITLGRRVFCHLGGPQSICKCLEASIPILFVGNIFTNQLKPNKDCDPERLQLVSLLLLLCYHLCSSGTARKLLRQAGFVALLCTLVDHTEVELYEPCMLCMSKLVIHNNQAVLQELIATPNTISRICSLLLPAASTQLLRASALVLAKVANMPRGDVVVTESGGIQPLINMLTVDDTNTLMAACQVIVGISSKPSAYEGDPDAAEASIFSINHMIAQDLIAKKVLVHIQALLEKAGMEAVDVPPPGTSRARLYRVQDDVSRDLFDVTVEPKKPGPSRPHSQQRHVPSQASLEREDVDQGKGGLTEPIDRPLSNWANLTSWLLHALANVCPSESIVPHFKKNTQLLKILLGLAGSCNPCVIRWACHCLANLAKHTEVARSLQELGALDILFSLLKRCIDNDDFENEFGSLAKAVIVSSASEALTGILEDTRVARAVGQSMGGIFDLVIHGLKTITNGTARAWLCGVVACLAKDYSNALILLEYRIVDYISYLCLEASQLLDSVDFTLREQICLAISNICTVAPFYRSGRGDGDEDEGPKRGRSRRRCEKRYENPQQQHMYQLLQNEYAKYGECYGDGNVLVEFGKRGVVAAVCTFLAPVSMGEHVQKVSLQEFQCLRAAATAAFALSGVGRNALLFYREGCVERLLYLIAIGDKATQASAANAIRSIRTQIYAMMNVLRQYRGEGVGVYMRAKHLELIDAMGDEVGEIFFDPTKTNELTPERRRASSV